MRSLRLVSVASAVALPLFLAVAVFAPTDFGPLYLNPASILLGAFVLGMGWLVAAYSRRNLHGQRRQGRFAALLALALTSLWALVVADPLWLGALAWSVSGLSVAGLVAHADTPAARSAARRVAARLAVGDAALWAAIALLAMQGIDERSNLNGAGWVVAALLASAGIVRSALVPAWRWLPLTAQAPSPVSALLHAGVVNGLGLLAVLWWPLFSSEPAVLVALVGFGLMTAVAGTVAVRIRPDVKGRLASSTSAQMGYMTVQVGLGLPALAMLHLVGHGFYKAWSFLRAGGAPRRAGLGPIRGASPMIALLLAVPVALAVVAGTLTWSSRPVVDLVPLTVAAFTALMALIALRYPTRTARAGSTGRARALAGATVLIGLFGYVALLGFWSQLFNLPGVFSGVVAAGLTAGVLLFGALGMLAASKGWLDGLVRPVALDTAHRVRGVAGTHPVIANASAEVAIDAAARLVGPMWPIHSAVAVNPLHELQSMSFADSASLAARTWGARAYLPESDYLQALRSGRFTEADLCAAAHGLPLPADRIAGYLQDVVHWSPGDWSQASAAELLEGISDEALAGFVDDQGLRAQTLGEQAGVAEQVSGLANGWTALLVGQERLWPAFQVHVRDFGLRGLADEVRRLPAEPDRAVASLLRGVVPEEAHVGYLARLLTRDPGWAAHLRQRDPSLIADLLAIRVAFDVMIAATTGCRWQPTEPPDPRERAVAAVAPIVDLLGVGESGLALELARRLDAPGRAAIWQRAWERRYGNRLVDRVTTRAGQAGDAEPVDAQVVVCIDVRSERLRRHLEAAGRVATYGYAGFFGLAVRHERVSGAGSDQCPVLLSAALRVEEADAVTSGGYARAIRDALVTAGQYPAAPFALAESIGALAGLDSALQTASPKFWQQGRERLLPPLRGGLDAADMELEQAVTAAATMLRALGLVQDFARILLVTGHAASVENNAFAAAYDCGACGGHSGYVNARLMARILNDPEVRVRLAEEHGIEIPDGCRAVPAWHDTTTDEVRIDDADVDADLMPDVAALRDVLDRTRDSVLAERMADLPQVRGRLASSAAARAADWAQPQPEWGLAGNAAFVIGPRSMTKGLNLRGRVFLHSYEPGLDVDGAILTTLLTAPMVVTQWINNQYYFATVDPERFGAGDKTTHNVMGDFGVVTGAGGDLRVGLPWQSLFRRQPGLEHSMQHEPLRLLVVVYASPDDIDAVLRENPQVASLVANQWIFLAAIDPGSGQAQELGPDLAWREWLGIEQLTTADREM